MGLAEAAILTGGLHGGGGFDRFAKGLHRHPRRRRDMLFARGDGGLRRRHRFVVRGGDLTGVLDHFPSPLILPVS
jgi:hypothetical protein